MSTPSPLKVHLYGFQVEPADFPGWQLILQPGSHPNLRLEEALVPGSAPYLSVLARPIQDANHFQLEVTENTYPLRGRFANLPCQGAKLGAIYARTSSILTAATAPSLLHDLGLDGSYFTLRIDPAIDTNIAALIQDILDN